MRAREAVQYIYLSIILLPVNLISSVFYLTLKNTVGLSQYDNIGESSESIDLAEEYPTEGGVDYSAPASSTGGICPIQISWQGNGYQGFVNVLQTAYAHSVDDNNTWTIR